MSSYIIWTLSTVLSTISSSIHVIQKSSRTTDASFCWSLQRLWINQSFWQVFWFSNCRAQKACHFTQLGLSWILCSVQKIRNNQLMQLLSTFCWVFKIVMRVCTLLTQLNPSRCTSQLGWHLFRKMAAFYVRYKVTQLLKESFSNLGRKSLQNTQHTKGT